MSNKAAYLTAAKAYPLEVRDAPMLSPRSHEVLIKVLAVAINPVDAMIQKVGMIVEQYPSVIGVDMAGEVAAVGSDVKNVKVGDRVTASGDSSPGDTVLVGTFQRYCTTHYKLVAKIPDSMSYTDACVLPLAMATSCTALFDKRCMGLELPRIGAKSTGTTLLVWGGASSVGSCGIQAARAAGYDVITTASKKNFDHCRSLGVKEVFDYNSSSVVNEVVDYLKGKKSAGVFDAIMAPETLIASNEIARRADGYKHVGTVLPEGMPLPENLPEEVTTSYNWGTWLRDNEVGEVVFNKWMGEALADGSLQCMPPAEIVGKGLGQIQNALDMFLQGGVSAKKLVVDLSE